MLSSSGSDDHNTDGANGVLTHRHTDGQDHYLTLSALHMQHPKRDRNSQEHLGTLIAPDPRGR